MTNPLVTKRPIQGVIGSAKRRNGVEQEIHVYAHSSDFPEYNLVILSAKGELPTERVPINEDIWRKIGESLGYRFRKPHLSIKIDSDFIPDEAMRK